MIRKRYISIIKNFVLLGTITIVAAGIVTAFPSPTKAVQLAGPIARGERIQDKASVSANQQDDTLARIKLRADRMISVRLTTLQNLSIRIQNDKRLSSDEKNSLLADIATATQQLTALKTKIDADTDVTTARTDTKSIVTNYHIYLYFEPKERLLITIDNFQTASTNLNSFATHLQSLLTNLKNQGKDITAAQTALNDITTQITAINTLLATEKSLVSNVNLQTTDPHSIFSQALKDLATVRNDVAKIRADFANIRSTLKQNGITPSATESAK